MKKHLILISVLLTTLLSGCAEDSSSGNGSGNGGGSVDTKGTIVVPDQLGSYIEITNNVKQEEVWPVAMDFVYTFSKPIQEVPNSVILYLNVGAPEAEPGLQYNAKGTYMGYVAKMGSIGPASSAAERSPFLQAPYTGTTRIAFLNKTQVNELTPKMAEMQKILENMTTSSFDYPALQTICNEIIEMTKNDTFIYTLYVEK